MSVGKNKGFKLSSDIYCTNKTREQMKDFEQRRQDLRDMLHPIYTLTEKCR